MTEINTKTLSTYNDNIQAYIDGTVQKTSSHQKEWLDFVFRDVPKEATILEIGAAFGRDASYIMEQGYKPDLSDGSGAFVDYLNQHGFTAAKLDIVNERPTKLYDVILACAVFLHFTDEDFRRAVAHVKEALEPGGKFAFSLKQGDGEEWSEHKMDGPRYFNYWRRDALEAMLHEVGMKIIDFQILDEGRWLHVVSTKWEPDS